MKLHTSFPPCPSIPRSCLEATCRHNTTCTALTACTVQEVRYNADYQLVEMERRVARAEGHRSRDETAVLGGRIKELEGTLAAAQAAHGMLVEEVKRAQDDYGAHCVLGECWGGAGSDGWCLLHATLCIKACGKLFAGRSLMLLPPKASTAAERALCHPHHPRLPALPACAARAQRHSQAVQRERGAILDDMSRLALESGAAGRAAKAAAREREERLVEVDMGRLEVRRLRMALSRQARPAACCLPAMLFASGGRVLGMVAAGVADTPWSGAFEISAAPGRAAASVLWQAPAWLAWTMCPARLPAASLGR